MVHGMVTSVTPMKGKSANKFFDGYVSDRVKKLRFIGLSTDKTKQLEQRLSNKEHVILTECCIKHARYGNQLEVIIGDRTDISTPALTFEVEDLDIAEPESKLITLNEFQNLPPYQKIVMEVYDTKWREEPEVEYQGSYWCYSIQGAE